MADSRDCGGVPSSRCSEAPRPGQIRPIAPDRQMMVVSLGTAGDAGVRPRLRCRSDLRHPRRRCPRAGLLDRRGGAHDSRHQRLHRRRGNVHRRYAPAPQWTRRRAGASGRQLSRLLRQTRRGLGRNRVHEVARGSREPRTGHGIPSQVCKSWTGAAMGRAAGRARNWRRCAHAWRKSRARAIR